MSGETFIACFNVVKELLQDDKPFEYGNSSIPHHHRSLIEKNGQDGSKFYLHCGIIGIQEHLNNSMNLKYIFEGLTPLFIYRS